MSAKPIFFFLFLTNLASKEFPNTVYSRHHLSSVKVQAVIVSNCIILLPARRVLENTHKCSGNHLKPLWQNNLKKKPPSAPFTLTGNEKAVYCRCVKAVAVWGRKRYTNTRLGVPKNWITPPLCSWY